MTQRTDDPFDELAPLYYYSSIFTPEKYRQTSRALLQYWQTLNQVRLNSTDVGVARLKLQWWQQQWQKTQSGAQVQHPLATTLSQHFKTTDTPDFTALAQYQDRLMQGQQPVNQAELKQLSQQGYARLFSLLLQLQGKKPEDEQHTLNELAYCATLAQHINEMGTEIKQGRCLLPKDHLQQDRLNTELLSQQPDKLEALLETMRKDAENIYSQIHYKNTACLVPLLLTRLLLNTWQEIARDHYPVFKCQTHLTPIRMLWTGWRLQRSLKTNN